MSDISAAGQDYLDGLARQTPARDQTPASLSEIWNATWTRGGLDTIGGVGKPFTDAYDELSSAIETAAGKPIGDLAYENNVNMGAAVTPDQRIAALGALADTLDDEQRKTIEPLKDVRRRAAEKAQKIESDAADVDGRTYGLTGIATSFVAGVARQTVDPANLALMAITAPIGGPMEGPLLKVIGRQAAAGAAAQAAVEPYVQPARAELGLEAGYGHAAGDVAQAAIGGGVLAGLFRGGAAALRAFRGRRVGLDSPPEKTAPTLASENGLASESGTVNAGPSDVSTPAGTSPIERMFAAAHDGPPAGSSEIERVFQAASAGDMEAAAHLAERDHVIVADLPREIASEPHATIAEAGRDIEAGRPVLAGDLEPSAPRALFGQNAKPEAQRSLFEFLASRGGLEPEQAAFARGDLQHVLDGNPFVPGFGKLIRKGGMTLDRAWEAAVEAGYINDTGVRDGTVNTTSANDLLDMVAEEGRGNKQYRMGQEPQTVAARAAEAAALERARDDNATAFDTRMRELGVEPPPWESHARYSPLRKRALALMEAGEADPLKAYDAALAEREAKDQARRAARNVEPIDVPFGDEPAGKPIGDPIVAKEAERAIADAGENFEITVPNDDGTFRKMRVLDAFEEFEQDQIAAKALQDCIGGTTP